MVWRALACAHARHQVSTNELPVREGCYSHSPSEEQLKAATWLLDHLWALEHELVHVAIEMLWAHIREMPMGEPSPEALSHQPEPLAWRRGPNRGRAVPSPHLEHLRAWGHHPADKPVQVVGAVRDSFNPDSGDRPVVAISKRSSKFKTASACQLSRLTAKVEHPHPGLDFAAQGLVLLWSHYATELVHPSPGGLVAGESNDLLKHTYGDRLRVLRHNPGHPEPVGDRHLRAGEDRPGCQRRLVPAPRALDEPAVSDWPSCPAGTARADEPIRPTELSEVLPAIRFRRLFRQPIRGHQILRLPELCGERYLAPLGYRKVGDQR